MTRLGMLIDLKRCVGCGACVVACQLENNQKEGVSWITIDNAEWGEEIGESGRVYVPRACMHCVEPPCAEVCPTGASKIMEDGVVVMDYEACINCGSCIKACPYGARILNKTRTNYFFQEQQAPYEAYGEQRVNVVEKCDFCDHRVAKGLKPSCTVNCPGIARYFGDLEDPESDVSKRIAWGDAVRIGETSFYYTPVNGMPDSAYPSAAAIAAAKEAGDDNQDNVISPVAVTVGAVAVAAVAAGVGVGVKKAKKSDASEVNEDE